jgi:nicotinate-nucleotide adenylyltransferase
MRLGILGGTFDPIHYGHLFLAEEARARFRLDGVVFVPNGIPPHKNAGAVTPAAHRYALTLLAIQDNPAFRCSPMEMQRAGPAYTVETLAQLHAENPGVELFYITGVDAIADILTWRRPDEVIRLATFIAASRPGFDLETLQNRLPSAYLERVQPMDSPMLNISSTEIRMRLRQNLPVRYLLPDAALEYICAHGLYRKSRAIAPVAPVFEGEQQ